jgi:cobaltochelatase CobS
VAGQRIFWLTGPSGSGKTTLAQIAAQRLELPCTLVSCCAGTSPGEFRGFQFPEPRPSAFTSAFGLPGVIIADEITTLDPSVAAVLNAALANTEINTVCGVVKRDPECIIIATSNTMGTGADRQYIGNNQLDAATLDRFKGGRRFVDYNEAYERSSFDAEIVSYVHRARRVVSEHKLRRIVSTRAIIAAQIDKEAGMEWRDTVTDDWTPEEKAILGRAA